MEVWTVGHSTRELAEFVAVLQAHQIALIADVRQFPGSRRYPHFGGETLAQSLRAKGIDYEHFANLGGRRQPLADSRNTAWRNAAFRGYADYMETEPFLTAMKRLLEVSSTHRTAIMCAEAVWWRCHRSLIADYLKSQGHDVRHIFDEKKVEPHPWTSAARLADGQLSYAELL